MPVIHDPAFERWRAYLLLLARAQLNAGGAGKIDASDIVQDALLEAVRQRARFRGTTDAEAAAWLRRLLTGKMIDALRHAHADKRDARRERSLDAEIEQSSLRLERFLAADQSSPSQGVQRQEQLAKLAQAMVTLPPAQREAVELRHCLGLGLDKIAEQMGKSPAAVAGLLKRGLQQLRQQLQETSS
jgi:RNA polymerase sigma-70 factor (ECF subfamily)